MAIRPYKIKARNLQPITVMTDCIFCDIIAKKAPATILYEDDSCVVIKTNRPMAPIHLLIIPRAHIISLNELTPEDEALAGHLLLTAKKVMDDLGLAEKGYRVAINTGEGGGQTVFHLHVHVLSGAKMDDSMLAHGLA